MSYIQSRDMAEEDVDVERVRAVLRSVLPDVRRDEEDAAVHAAREEWRNGEAGGGAEGIAAAAVDLVLARRERTATGRRSNGDGDSEASSACARLVGADELPSLRAAGSSARIKLAELHRRLPGWDPALLELAFRENGLDLRQTLSALTDAFGEMPEGEQGAVEDGNDDHDKTMYRGSIPSVPRAQRYAQTDNVAAAAASSVTMTGARRRGGEGGSAPSASSSSSSFARGGRTSGAPCSSRKLLRRVCDVAPRGYHEALWTRHSGRGKLFNLASEASRRGDGEAARQLAQRAHGLGSEAEADRALVVERMAAPFAYQEDGEEHQLDLHGLTVDDATTVVRAHIAHARERLTSMGMRSDLVIITGRGTHSAHGRPKLYLSVADVLRASRVGFRDDFDMSGALTVSFR